jgi:hypothetical protein
MTRRQASIVPSRDRPARGTTRALVEQTGAVDAGRLGELVGTVSPEQQWGIDDALMTVPGSASRVQPTVIVIVIAMNRPQLPRR